MPGYKRNVGGKEPVVYSFQPTGFEAVTDETLQEWEFAVRNYVDLSPQEKDSLVSHARDESSGTGTFSRTGPTDSQYDDCDQDWM